MNDSFACPRPGCDSQIPSDFRSRGADGRITFSVWRAEGDAGFGVAAALICGVCANDLYDFWNSKERARKLS